MIGNEAARGTEFQAFGGSKPNHVTLAIYTINWRTYGFGILKWISKNSVLTIALMSTAPGKSIGHT
jgi:hypothetical protein